MAQERRQLTPREFWLRKIFKLKILGLAALERVRKRQAARTTWLKAGDAKTAFFQAKINSRRRKNYIHCLESESRQATDHKEKAKMIHDHFTTLLGSKERRTKMID